MSFNCYCNDIAIKLAPDFDCEVEQVQNYESGEEDASEGSEDESEEDKESVVECNIHEITSKPLNDENLGECPICYEQINMINATITRCGHVMHSSCVFTALESSPSCPMCRTQLMRDIDEEEEEEEEYDDEEEEDQEDENQSGESADQDTRISVEQLAKKLQNMGYTPVDILMMYFSGDNIKTEKQEKYSDEFLGKLDDDMFGILNGSISLNIRDKRTYAEVVKSSTVYI